MSVETNVIFETDEQLQAFMGLGVLIPNMRVWCKVPTEDYNAKCDSLLGDGRYKMSVQFYGVEVGEYTYVVMARTEVVNGVPTGNYQGPISLEEQNAWVEAYGAESMRLEPPQVEEVV